METPCSSMERAAGRPLFRGPLDLEFLTPKCPKHFQVGKCFNIVLLNFFEAFRSLFQRGGF